MPRNRISFFISIFLIAASCAETGPENGTSTPDLYPRVTASTGALVRGLAASYARVNGLDYRLERLSQDELVATVAADAATVGVSVHPPPAEFWSTPLAWDGLAVVVNPDNPLTGLTREELKDIFLGRIVEWHVLPTAAGMTGAINLVVREPGSDARAAFEAVGLEGLSPSLNALVAPGPSEMLEAVAEDPAAIGVALVSQIDDRVRAVAVEGTVPSIKSLESGAYPLRVPVLAFAQAEPSGPMREFLLWVQSEEGQAMVRATHGGVR